MNALNEATLARWRAAPTTFIEEVLINPETGKPFVLLDAEVQFLQHAFKTSEDGRLLYPEQIYAAVKKSGKTTFAAIYLLTVLLLFGSRYSEAYCVANDFEQAQGRVFELCRRIIAASPLLRRDAKITADRIAFPVVGATIAALASDYASAAGAHPTISVFDELWAYTNERARRLWDEMIPVPTRRVSCRLVTTHAGFSGESSLLEDLQRRGLAQPQVATDLYAGDGLLMFWSNEPIAPWQTPAWLVEMRRSLRPNQYLRMIENRFVATESSFIELTAYDRCVDATYRPVLADYQSPVWCAVDASVKHDSTALVAVAYDRERQRVRLLTHKIFQPTPERPIDFEGAIESTLLNWSRAFRIKAVLFDPYQMTSVSQRLTRDGIKMVEFPQTSSNLTAAAENLFELIRGGNLCVYPDQQIRMAISQTVAIESSRGWRIGKEKQSHKIDVVVALAMASLYAVHDQRKRGLRTFQATGSDLVGRLIEVDPLTGRPLGERPRGRLVKDADGNVYLAGGDNSCWSTEELKKLRKQGVLGLY